MLDNELYKLLISIINDGLAARGVDNALVRQSYQPTQQAVKKNPAIFIHKIHSPQGSYGLEYNEDGTRTQITYASSVFQIDALSPQDPEDINAITAYDLLTYVSDELQSPDIIKKLNDHGLGILRVTDISPTEFKNNWDQFELSPSFTVTIVNNRRYTKAVDQVDRVQGQDYGV